MNIVYAGVCANPNGELALLRSLLAGTAEDKLTVWLPETSASLLESTLLRPEERVFLGGGVGVATVATAALDIRSTDSVLSWLIARWTEQRPDLVLFPASALGHELAVRMSARLSLPCYPETRSLARQDQRLLGRKKVCGSNLDWEFAIETPAILTVSPRKAFVPESAGQGSIETKTIPLDVSVLPRWLLGHETLEPYQSNPLETAPLVFAAGRGLGSAASCERLRRIAACYGAPLGFSRPAALNGWGKIDDIIGQSGLKTQAAVCIAVGVSGAAAFMAGIESVEHLIAVNTDKNAPIFQYADWGIIATGEDFITALEGLSPQYAIE